MHVWFNSESCEAKILHYLEMTGETELNGLIDAVFGQRPASAAILHPSVAADLDRRAAAFFSAMGALLEAGYIKKAGPDKRFAFSLGDAEKMGVLLAQCADL